MGFAGITRPLKGWLAMPRELQIYEGMTSIEPAEGEELPIQRSPEPGLATVWSMLCRRWKMVLAVWLLLALPALVGVYLWVKPTFTATAIIQITPVVPRILYEDEYTRQPPPLFDSFLHTQAQLVASPQVLTAALAPAQASRLAEWLIG